MFTAIDISTSGLVAQRARVNAIAGNIANMSSQRNENGDIEPYQARHTIFQTDDSIGDRHGAAGVRVASVETDTVQPLYKLDPDNPLAVKDGKWKGYVAYPRVNMIDEMVDAMEAARAYEANISVIDVSKNLFQQSLKILA